MTVERCTTDATPTTATAPGNNDWCLLRGIGWVRGRNLVNLSADPAMLLPHDNTFDPLKSTAPAWDDLDASPDDTPSLPLF